MHDRPKSVVLALAIVSMLLSAPIIVLVTGLIVVLESDPRTWLVRAPLPAFVVLHVLAWRYLLVPRRWLLFFVASVAVPLLLASQIETRESLW